MPQPAPRPGLLRRRLAAGLALAPAWALGPSVLPTPASAAPAQPQQGSIRVMDQEHRLVQLPRPARRIVLTDTSDFFALSLIDPHPARRLAAWNRWQLDAETLTSLRRADPAFDHVRQLSINGPTDFPVEQILALEPDLVVLIPRFSVVPRIRHQLETAGIAVAVLQLTPDLRADNPVDGLQRLGRLIGQQEQADAYAAFYLEHLRTIRTRVASVKDRPLVLFEPHAGRNNCCLSVGRGPSIGDLVTTAGGEHIGAQVIPGMAGQLSMEYVLSHDPDIYIGVGGAYLAPDGLVLGISSSTAQARASLRKVCSRPAVNALRAVREGRAHGLWFPLTGALNIVALEAVARWLHPGLFADIDPQRTLDTINQRFLSASLHGTFWVDLKPDNHRPT